MTEPKGGNLENAAFSPDGKQLVTAGNARYARIWDVKTHRSVAALSAPGASLGTTFSDGSAVTDATFSPNGKLIVTSGRDGGLALWSAAAPYQQVASTSYSAPLYGAVFNPSSTQVLTASGRGSVQIWSVRTLKAPVRTLYDGAAGISISILPNVTWSNSGKLILAAGLDAKAYVWQASSTRSTPMRRLQADDVSVLDVAVNSNGDRAVTAGADGAARIWDLQTGRQLAVLHTSGQDPVQAAAMSADGRFVGTASYEGNVNLWDATNGKPQLELTLPHGAGATGIRIPPVAHGDLLAVAGGDGYGYIFDPKNGDLLTELHPKLSDRLAVIDFSDAANEWMTAGQENGNGVVRFWRYLRVGGWTEVGNPNGLVVSDATIYDAAFSPDGKLVVTATDDGSGDGKAQIWSSSGKDTKPLATIDEPYSARPQGTTLRSAEFSPDGKLILTASEDGTARVWGAMSSRHPLIATVTDPQGEALRWAAFSADPRWMATASLNGTARVWDLASGRPLLTLAGHSGQGWTTGNDPASERVAGPWFRGRD